MAHVFLRFGRRVPLSGPVFRHALSVKEGLAKRGFKPGRLKGLIRVRKEHLLKKVELVFEERVHLSESSS